MKKDILYSSMITNAEKITRKYAELTEYIYAKFDCCRIIISYFLSKILYFFIFIKNYESINFNILGLA
jgi:hypothetical protein